MSNIITNKQFSAFEQKAMEMTKHKRVSQWDFLILVSMLSIISKGKSVVRNKDIILNTKLHEQTVSKSLISLVNRKIIVKVGRGLYSLKTIENKEKAELLADVRAAKLLLKEMKQRLKSYEDRKSA